MRAPIVAELARTAPGERVMSPDAGAYRYHAGRPGIVTPNDPLPVVEQALRVYDVRWLVLERDHLVPALAPLLEGAARPSWLSAPRVVVQTGERAEVAATGPTGRAMPPAAMYAVCFDPGDERCAR